MAFETIYLDRSIDMASLAEIAVRAEHAVVDLACMAIHAVYQAVPADHALVHRDVALFFQQVAMIELHEFRIVYAMPTLADVEVRHPDIRSGDPGNHERQGQKDRLKRFHSYSPNPIWM